MSRLLRNMLISMAALLVVGAAVMFLLWAPDTAQDPADNDIGLSGEGTTQSGQTTATTLVPETDDDIVIVDKTKNEQGGAVTDPVVRIQIQNEKDTFTIAKREDNTMAVEAYKDLLPDSTAIRSMCDSLAYLTAIATPPANEEDAAYGFTAPKATVTVSYYDGTTATLTIGNESQGTHGYYCRLEGDETLYVVDTAVVGAFFTDGMQLIGKALIAPPAPNEDDESGQSQLLNLWLTGTCRQTPIEIMTDVDASYPGLTYVSTYVIKSPYLRAIDSDFFLSISSTIPYLTADGVAAVHPTVSQLEEFGLSNPYSVAAFTLSVTNVTSADNGGTTTSHYNDREHMILLGNKDENGNYYALIDQYDIVYLLTPASVPWAETQYHDVVSKLLFMKAITSVDSITVTDQGEAKTFALEHRPDAGNRDAEMVVTADGKTYSTPEFRILYQLMIGIKRVGNKEDGAAAQGEPVLSFKVTFNDGTEDMVMSLYPMTASRYLCVTADGEESAVSIRTVEDFLKQYHNYLNGDPVTSTY